MIQQALRSKHPWHDSGGGGGKSKDSTPADDAMRTVFKLYIYLFVLFACLTTANGGNIRT